MLDAQFTVSAVVRFRLEQIIAGQGCQLAIRILHRQLVFDYLAGMGAAVIGIDRHCLRNTTRPGIGRSAKLAALRHGSLAAGYPACGLFCCCREQLFQ